MTTRRSFLKAGVRLSAGFSVAFMLPISQAMAAAEGMKNDKLVNAWLDLDAQGRVILHAGKVELGTGLKTAMAQLVAEELNVAVANVIVLMGDTESSVDQGPTIGSLSLLTSTVPIRKAAATACAAIIQRASLLLKAPASGLATDAGYVYVLGDAKRRVAYKDALPAGWELLETDNAVKLKDVADFKVIGRSTPRVELPAKVNGTHAFIHNVRLNGMVHARVVHPPYPGAIVKSVDRSTIATLPGLIDVAVKDNFVAVVCETEFQAVAASRALVVAWILPQAAVDSAAIFDDMAAQAGELKTLRQKGGETPIPGPSSQQFSAQFSAVYRTPFQTHASIGPSCGLADVRGDSARIWSATQGSFPLRNALADLLQLPVDKVRVIWQEGSGCYGHNGADDASAEAAWLSQKLGRPVRVQWMRHDEHGWDPKGPATEMKVTASIGADGKIDAWDYLVSSPSHVARPGGSANNLLIGQLFGLIPKKVQLGADYCAATLYQFPHEKVAARWLPRSVLRASSLRGLGAFGNAFANESFMDELAAGASLDPIDLRRAHLTDPRAIAVLDEVRRISQWDSKRKQVNAADSVIRQGIGLAFVRLDRGGAFVATVCCVDVNMESGGIRVTNVYVAHDCGLIINPDGLRNQIEGNVVQAISRSLKESVKFSATQLQSLDWVSYPIIRFSEVPNEISISLLNRPNEPVVGAGEPTSMTIAPAIGSAVFHASGVRMRQIPFTAEQFQLSAGRPARQGVNS
jgi:nicotinate dehydrogenase subunit B